MCRLLLDSSCRSRIPVRLHHTLLNPFQELFHFKCTKYIPVTLVLPVTLIFASDLSDSVIVV